MSTEAGSRLELKDGTPAEHASLSLGAEPEMGA